MEHSEFLAVRYAITQVSGSTHISVTFNGVCTRVIKREDGKILDIQFCSTSDTAFVIRDLINDYTIEVFPVGDMDNAGFEIPKDWFGAIESLIKSCGMEVPIWFKYSNTVKVFGTFFNRPVSA